MKSLVICLSLSMPSVAFAADAMQDRMTEFAKSELMAWFTDPAIISHLQQANAANTGLTPDTIKAMDDQWRAEVGTDSALIKGIMENSASLVLRDRMGGTAGQVTEVILMDNHGMNVALSDVTSDYWQGDEDKFLETYAKGPQGMHLSEVELDESTQTYQAQVSFTIVDPATGQPIGAATVGLNAEHF